MADAIHENKWAIALQSCLEAQEEPIPSVSRQAFHADQDSARWSCMLSDQISGLFLIYRDMNDTWIKVESAFAVLPKEGRAEIVELAIGHQRSLRVPFRIAVDEDLLVLSLGAPCSLFANQEVLHALLGTVRPLAESLFRKFSDRFPGLSPFGSQPPLSQ